MSQYDSYNAKIRIFSEWSKLISQNLLEGVVHRFLLQVCQLANFFLKSLILASKPLQWTESGSLK